VRWQDETQEYHRPRRDRWENAWPGVAAADSAVEMDPLPPPPERAVRSWDVAAFCLYRGCHLLRVDGMGVCRFAAEPLTEQALREWEDDPNVAAKLYTSYQADVRRMVREAKTGGYRAA
jgi:hypothetical protein